MMDMIELIERLTELAEYVKPREWDLPLDLADVLREAAEKLKKMQWTRSEDKLPKPLESVLICRPKRARNDPLTVDMGYLRPDGTWRVRGTPLNRIRGWMPCPVPMEDDD